MNERPPEGCLETVNNRSIQEEKVTSGKLYIVATPIGNLEDMTFRAVRCLKEADLIAAEDTRTAKKLMSHYNINKPVTSYFEHNEIFKTETLIEKLLSGETIALISESGTPPVSDPGYRLVHEAINRSIDVIPVPGPCAAIAAISVSGLPIHRFCFEGFLPPKSGKRKNFLKSIIDEKRTLLLYESPHRILAALRDMLAVLGDRRAMLGRELTKLHEEKIYGNISDILHRLENRPVKGEITVVVEGKR